MARFQRTMCRNEGGAAIPNAARSSARRVIPTMCWLTRLYSGLAGNRVAARSITPAGIARSGSGTCTAVAAP